MKKYIIKVQEVAAMKRPKLLIFLLFFAVSVGVTAGFSLYRRSVADRSDMISVPLDSLGKECVFGQHILTNPSRLQADATHGKIIESRNDIVQGAEVDKVVLFVRESSESPRTIERNAILLRYPDAEGTIVVSHGFMCDKFDSTFLRNLFPKKQFNVLTFDYRAHGEKKDGQQCTFGRDEIYDLIAAARFLEHCGKTRNKPRYVYGFSMGAATPLLAQAQEPDLFRAMILDCPYDSTENIIKKSIDNLRFSICGYGFCLPGNGLLKKYAFHPYVQSLIKALLKSIAQMDSSSINTCIYSVSPSIAAKKITIPCFFIHCKRDERVPMDAVKRIYNNYSGVKKLWITNGRRHYDSYFYNPEMYTKRVRRFLDLVHRDEVGKHYKKKIIEDKEDVLFQGE